MLKQRIFYARRLAVRSCQSGVVMLVALIVLVVMTLAGIALMRSMDTSNLIAGNMAFKQSAINASDAGVEAAMALLVANNAGSGLDSAHPEFGYTPSSLSDNAYKGYALGDALWALLITTNGKCNLPVTGGTCSSTAVPDAVTGNAVSFVIQRLCNTSGNRTQAAAYCAIAPSGVITEGGNEGGGDSNSGGASSAIYYRITVRVQGPRNAVSYVQMIASL